MEKFYEKIKNMSNQELLTELYDTAMPDDYDGCFTDRGWREYEAVKAEFESRLLKCGYLTK